MKKIYWLYTVSCALLTAAVVIGLLVQDFVVAGCLAAGVAMSVLSVVFSEQEHRKREGTLQKDLTDMEEKYSKAEQEREAALNMVREQVLQFHSKVSHCLRIPFSVIQGYADLLKGDLLTDNAVREKYLSRISEKVMYMNELLSHLLIEARSEAEIPSLMMEPVDLCALVERTAEEISAAARMLDIAVNVVSSQPEILVNADMNLMTKIIYNILGNSLKYMNRSGTISITISEEEGQVLLILKDDGMGVASDEVDKIFDLNYQGSNKKSGDGFGLYYVKTGIIAHGGTVFAKSVPGCGMGIYISLPGFPHHSKEEKGKCSITEADGLMEELS